MLSPVIKTKNFNKDSGLLRASIDNLPIGSRLYVKFSNLEFSDVTSRVFYDDEINWEADNSRNSINFYFTINDQSDRFLFVQIKTLEKGSWVDFGVASLVVKEEESVYESSILSVSKSYISKDDKLEVHVRADPSSIYDLKINEKSFGFKTDSNGFYNLLINPVNFIEQSIINSKFVRSVFISLISRISNKEIAKTKIEFVPESLYALATTNDPSRPSCVILDPDPVPAFSVSSDPLSDFCYDQPLVGKAFFADGTDAANTTRIDSNYINCSNGYVSSAISVIDSDCKIYNSPKFVRFQQPLKYENFPSPSSESPSLHGLFGRDWISHRFGFCYSACDANIDDEELSLPVDPCSFSTKELKKIPRVWVGLSPDAIGISVSSIARGIIKAPPAYFHSIILKSTTIQNGDAVNVIFDLSSAERISKTLVYDSEIHSDAAMFLRSFAASISSDESIVSAGISVDIYEDARRIDVKSNNEFYIYPGQIDSVRNGRSVINDKIQVIKNSKYAFDFEITDPSRVDDIDNIFSKNNITHLLFLSGAFKGMMVAINKNEKNGNIVLDTCPRVASISGERLGLGTFIVEEDRPCTYVAFVSLTSHLPADSSVMVKSLPFVKNRFNEVVPSINPCITSDGRIFCQALIDGKWQIFGYFPPSIGSFGSNSINENYWIQLTDIGENRNISAASDYYGNIHLCWETDRFGFTSLQYSCIGKSQRFIKRLAMSGIFNKQIPNDLFAKIFSLNKNKVVDNFNQAESSNINIIREGGVISLVPGANVTGRSFSIVREFTGYLRIDDSDFESILDESPGEKIGSIDWDIEEPAFDKNTFVTSYLVHFDKRSSRNTSSESSSFTAKFEGKVLRIFISGTDLSESGNFLKSSSIRYPNQAVSFESSEYVNSGSISVIDENTVSFTFSYSGEFDIGPLQMRILVEGVYGQGSIDQSELSRVYSGGGRVSITSSDDVCINGSPHSDVSLGLVSVNKDYSGSYIGGQEYNLDFSVNCSVALSPSFKISKFINGPELEVVDPQYADFILERQDDSYVWNADSEPIIVVEEFGGVPGFDQPIQYASSFSYGGVAFEDQSRRYLPGFSSSSNVLSFSLSIRSPELLESISKSVYFDSPIVAIYIDEVDLEYTDPLLGNSVSSRPAYADIQNIKFSINKSRKLLNITLPSQTEIDFSIRIVLGGDLFLSPFSVKSDLELDKMFKEFSETFEQRDGSVFSFNNNRFTINKTEKRYDNFIPIMGSLKFDDLNSNPRADFSKFSNLSQLYSSTDAIDAVDCQNVSSSGTFEMISNFKVDGVDSNLHHGYVFLIPERISFVAKNSETLDEYSLRNGSIKGYREAMVTDIYTGFAKTGILSSGFYSAGLSTSFSRGVQLKVQDFPSVDISKPISLQVDFSYLRLSKEDVKLIERWSHPAEDAFFIPEKQKPFYHLMTNVYINNYPQISSNAQVDLSSKSRQWDFGFGMPFGLSPVCRSENINLFELLSKEDWKIYFSNIKIGSPTVVINKDYFENAENNYSFGKILSLVPNSDSNVENDIFSQSIIDPGDWVCLEDSNLLVDEWKAIYGGVIYCGSYVNAISGSRSIILESNIPYNSQQSDGSYYHLPMRSQRRGRISSGCFGGISQDFGTDEKNLDYEHYISLTFGLRPIPEQLPKVMKSIMIYVDGNVYSSKNFAPTGDFQSSASPLDMTTLTRSFYPSGKNLQLKILNTSNNLSQSFSGYHFTTNTECPLIDNYTFGTFYKNAIFYINESGILKCSLSSSLGDGNDIEDSEISTFLSNDIGEPFEYVSLDSRLRYEDENDNNPFAIVVDKNGYLKSVTFDGSENNIPDNFKQNSLPVDSGFATVSVGWNHGAALKYDGTVVCWGDNSSGQCNVPSSERFLQVKCGQNYTVGIKEDGTLLAWGDDTDGKVSNLPSGKFVQVDCGSQHSVAISIDGNAISWGLISGIDTPPSKFTSVCACGGNVYSLQSSSSSSLTIFNVKPFNVGIDTDGNLIPWGNYEEAFDIKNTAIENFHSQPPVPCVAIKGGIRSCLALGVDSKIYAYGISASPVKPGGISPIDSIYKNNNDYFSGGFVIDDCKVFSSNNLVDESLPADAYRLIGLSDNDAMNFTFGLYSYGITSIPMCDLSSVIQKNPTVHCDKFDKISIVYEDNSMGPWGIMEKSSIYLDRYLVDKIYLSSKLYSSFNPSIDSDDRGRRVVVWNSIKDKNYLIEHAKSDNHPDYVSDCDIDRIISGSRLLGFDSDPYDPYELEKSLMSCRVNLSFVAPVSSTYFFTISFVDINNENIVYKVSSSKIEPGKWLVNGSYLPYSGKILGAGESVVVTYIPDLEDNVYGKTLKVILNYTTEIVGPEDFQTIKLHNISNETLYQGYGDPRNVPVKIDGILPFSSEYLIFEESVKNSNISIPRQDSSYFESRGTDSARNLILPDGVDSLPGVEAGSFAKSFLVVLGDDGETSNSVVDASVTFSAPIAAILIDEVSLSATDIEFNNPSKPISIKRDNNISVFQFYSGEYMRLGDDRRTLYMRFYTPRKGSWPGSGDEKSRGPKNPVIDSLSTQDRITSAISVDDLFSASSLLSDSGSAASVRGALRPLASSSNFPFATFRVLLSNSGSASGSVESIFYCANPVEKNCRINAIYKNSSYEQKDVHFKISVYSDPDYSDSLMVFSSLEDSGLWNIGIDSFPLQGLGVTSGSSASVSFNPPLIDPSLGYYPVDSKSVEEYYYIGSSYMDYYNLNRKALMCGVKYYIKVSAIVEGDDIELYRSSFACECSQKFSDRENTYNWISPYNGSSNVEISKGTSRKSNPSVAGSRGGLFNVVWEDCRGAENYGGIVNNNNIFSDIYSAIIDLDKNKIESSAYQSQERMVKNTSSNDLEFDEEKMPIIKSDYFGNFSIFSMTDHNRIKLRHMSVGYKIKPDIIKESAIVSACSFTLTENNNYKSAFDGGEFLDIRISEKYVRGRIFSGKQNPLNIVDDCFVEVEVVGVPGAMGYRVKNESEIDFTDWIPIGSDLQPISSLGENIFPDDKEFRKTFKARWVGNEIFVFPWVLSSGNGVKRICIEILTAFGKTQQICLDVVAEYSGVSYSLEVMYSEKGEGDSGPIFSPIRYKGIPVVNRKTWYSTSADGDIVLSKNDLRSLNLNDDEYLDVEIFVKINFEDPNRIARLLYLNSLKRFIERRSSDNDFSLTLYQQGSVVQSSTIQVLNEKNGEYFGKFEINKNNGVTFKDGLGFILVNIPFECFNPFVKNFSSVLRLIGDQRLDRSSVKIQDNNKFIENYASIDKRNLFGTKRINP